MSRHQSRGFSLIELLITLVVIGVIAAISLPNLMAAIDKGKQKRTMADLRSIGTAVGWDHPFVVDSEATAYTISSSGKDGAPSGCVIGTLTTRFDQDICFSHGQFIQYPVGPQD